MLSLEVTLAGRKYPIRVKPEDEAFVAEAVQKLQDKLNEFKGLFPGKETVDYLAMSALMNMVETAREQQSRVQSLEQLNQAMQHVEDLLNDSLKK